MNRTAGSTPGDLDDDPGSPAPSPTANPDGRDGAGAGTEEARRPQAEAPNRLPDGYEPL